MAPEDVEAADRAALEEKLRVCNLCDLPVVFSGCLQDLKANTRIAEAIEYVRFPLSLSLPSPPSLSLFR